MRGRALPSFVDIALATAACGVVAFLFAPIVTVVLYSFNEGVEGRQTAVITAFTTHWFGDAWDNEQARHSLEVSLKVAIATALLAALMGTITGFALARRRNRAVSALLEVLVYLLLIVPEIVLAVSLLLVYTKTGVTLGMTTLIASHTPFTTAVVAMIVRSRVLALDRSLEDAASDLGAASWRAFVDVVLPLVRPAILAGMLLAFTFSFDSLVISVFLATPDVNTLPVYLYSSVRSGVRPDVYALATTMLVFTLAMVMLTALLYRWLASRTGTRPSGVGPLAAEPATEGALR